MQRRLLATPGTLVLNRLGLLPEDWQDRTLRRESANAGDVDEPNQILFW